MRSVEIVAGMAQSTRGAEIVYDALVGAGIEHVVGLPGTQTRPLDRIVAERDEMTYVMARHETAIPHVAWGYYEASGRPAATLTVPGPGDTNAMHGLKNALEDCVPIVHVSADIDPADRGKGPIHEIESDTFDNVVKANLTVERPAELPTVVARGIELALSPPTGPVRLGIPSGLLAAEIGAPGVEVRPERTTFDNDDAVERAVDLLAAAERPVVYVGGGARRSADGPRVVRALADRLDAPVLATFKGKGVVPEDDPRFLGVTGKFLPAGARRVLERADVVLALGTDFDGPATDDWTLPMGDRLVHVTRDPGDIGVAYEPDVAIVDDVTVAGDRLLEELPQAGGWDGSSIGNAVREEYEASLREDGLLDRNRSPATTPALFSAVREATPREAIVTVDVGGFRLWALEYFPAYAPETFVAAGSWAGMGVGLPGAVGAALARPDRPVVSLIGDGGLMMCAQEIHTAVEHDLDVTVVVSNNADYGIISKGLDAGGFAWDAPDFATVAAGFDCRGTRVETASEAGEAVSAAIGRSGPDLIDVAVQTDEPSVIDAAEYESAVELE